MRTVFTPAVVAFLLAGCGSHAPDLLSAASAPSGNACTQVFG